MNAEALIGKVLGTCTLQRLVGQGGMGAVYLAQQSRPRRQVAVKVLLPITQLNAHQLAAFLERFRRETDAAASLEHPNIMPVHEYGEQDGIAYLVMPYVSGGTLRDELERVGPLSLQQTVNYLEQLAAALDFAHEHGVIHRDIKPANIMLTLDGRLLLSDFGLVKIVAENQMPQMRLTGAGAPVGTPDYMAPEQVIGDDVDTRADLYSLGVILFQMLTGTTPFQGETPMQIAAQHLQIPPPSPQMLRPDLPIATEQVVLRAMAKRPADRFTYGQEMARAFRQSLISSGIILDQEQNWAGLLNGSTASRMAIPKGQFDPIRQTASMPKVVKPVAPTIGGGLLSRAGLKPGAPAGNQLGGGGLLNRAGVHPSAEQTGTGTAGSAPIPGGGLLSKTGRFPKIGVNGYTAIAGSDLLPQPGSFIAPASSTNQATGSHTFAPATLPGMGNQPPKLHSAWTQEPPVTPQTTGEQANTALIQNPTGALINTGQLQPSTTVKLNDPVKVVKVPVAGQPGRYITGILPFEKQPDNDEVDAKPKKVLRPWQTTLIAVVAALVVLGALGSFFIFQNQANQPGTQQANTGNSSPNSTMARATATASANILVDDPLDKDINGWPTTPSNAYAFKNGAYDVTDLSGDRSNGIFLSGQQPFTNVTYTLSMQELQGDTNNPQNTFGMIFRISQQPQKKGNPITTFYSFEVVNTKTNAQYQFWSYNDSQKNAWTLIKTVNVGKEFHIGNGMNTMQIKMNGNKFTATINGKTITPTFQDNALKSGSVGMIVNNKGTQVAFSHLLVTIN